MQVLLKEDVQNLGFAGEVYKVAAGYGRNYLLPQGLAVKASPSVMKQAVVWRKKAETRREEIRAEFEVLSQKIQGVILNFTAKAGETGKLYGSITTAQIADALNEKLGTEIDRRKVGVDPLRQLGSHPVPVRLSGEFQPQFTVVIESEDTPDEVETTDAEEPEAAQATEEAVEQTTAEVAEEGAENEADAE